MFNTYFNPNQLELLTDRDPMLTKELLGIYLEETEKVIATAKELHAAAAFDDLKKILHKHKSSYQMIGLAEMYRLIASAEGRIGGAEADIPKLLDEALEVHFKAAVEIEDYFVELGIK
jgi:HPt (histidine-containing phosphotransfer) domain-containing protein